MIFIIMGLSGAGKTTVGKILAEKIGCPFDDADDCHSTINKQKMNNGIPLTDADHKPWLKLKYVRNLIEEQREHAVIACSALKNSYRDYLSVPGKEIVFVYLKGDAQILRQRLSGRKWHYVGPELLDSQLKTLKVPEHAQTFDITDETGVIAGKIIDSYEL